jgi:hypothetical protein
MLFIYIFHNAEIFFSIFFRANVIVVVVLNVRGNLFPVFSSVLLYPSLYNSKVYFTLIRFHVYFILFYSFLNAVLLLLNFVFPKFISFVAFPAEVDFLFRPSTSSLSSSSSSSSSLHHIFLLAFA